MHMPEGVASAVGQMQDAGSLWMHCGRHDAQSLDLTPHETMLESNMTSQRRVASCAVLQELEGDEAGEVHLLHAGCEGLGG